MVRLLFNEGKILALGRLLRGGRLLQGVRAVDTDDFRVRRVTTEWGFSKLLDDSLCHYRDGGFWDVARYAPNSRRLRDRARPVRESRDGGKGGEKGR